MTENFTRYEVWIPACFAEDHSDRDLPCGEFLEAHKRKGRRYRCTPGELAEWKSDATYYSDCAGFGWDIEGALGMQSSARATVKRVSAVMEENGVPFDTPPDADEEETPDCGGQQETEK
jgi:hypothetical protein